jgi:predicted ATPase/class 3 adenylate cyclase
MSELPTGTVTFLFTDLEGSSRLWEEHPEAMKGALARHDEILRGAVEGHGGHVVKTTGDGVHAVFATAHDAVDAALEAQCALSEEEWGTTRLRVRMGIHTGEAELRGGDYYGGALNRAARLMSVAHGGQIVVSLTTEELVRDGGYEFGDLGEHRLRDLARAERVFQLNHAGLASEFPPLRSLDAFPGNLPLQLTSFVGREEELRVIAKALDSTRLVTLTGVGGVGKTRLATQAAAEVLPHFADGAWFCELAAATDAEALYQVVASTLGVNPRPGTTLDGSIVEFLASKRLLVVLDNCEHLLGAAARLAQGILRGCPTVSVLATSREGLAVEGERNLTVGSLSFADAGAGSAAIETSDAMRLFVDRAVDAGSAFVVDDAGLADVAEICRRLDGIPLAIELAAARTPAMSPGEIAARLDERFRLLTGGRRTAVERHQTLRATVDWSYSLLGRREQAAFNRLGVFAGSFDAGAAEAIVSGDGVEPWDVLDALVDLVAKSMVVAERSAQGTRYQLNETMRAYARERLDEAGEGDTWRRLHAQHYAAFAETAGPGTMSADELVWRPRLRQELDNIRAAVTWSLDRVTTEDVEYAIRIIAALSYEALQDRASGVGTWAERAVDLAQRTEPVYRAPILAAAAESVLGQGDLHRARALAADALRDGIPARSPQTALAYIVLTVVDAQLGDVALAYQEIQDGIAQAQAAIDGDSFAAPGLQSVAAIWAASLGDVDAARSLAQASLATAQRVANPTLLSVAHFVAGNVIEHEDPSAALAHYDETIALVRAGAAHTIYASALSYSAVLLARAGNYTEALARARQAIERAHHDADMTYLVAAVAVTIFIFATLGWHETVPELAGIVTLGKYAHLIIATLASRAWLPETIQRLRAELGADAFDEAAARAAGMDAEEIATFTLSSIDRAIADLAGGTEP